MANSEQKIFDVFDAAVNVIRSLPKTGSFQPSHDMMLKFYGYYKQAKEGPCKEAKPGFWDLVKKAKWEAWSKLGNTSKEDAMANYVNELKQVMAKMPETRQELQFIDTLQPFYNVAYKHKENAPPIFNIFRAKHNNEQHEKMNGHLDNGSETSEENGIVTCMQDDISQERLNTSKASLLHNIEMPSSPENGLNGNIIEATNLVNSSEREKIKDKTLPDIKEGSLSSNNHLILNESVGVGADDNGHRDDDDGDDDDDLFCDSLGPELLEKEVTHKEMLHSGVLESVQEDTVHVGGFGLANHSSLSDVEVIEHFGTKNNGESSTPHLEKITRDIVHFEDSSAPCREQDTFENIDGLSKTCDAEKKCVVQPNQLGAGTGGGNERELLRATSERQEQVPRNVSQQPGRPARYGHRYRRKSRESDSDESPGRSDHNSSSERDDSRVFDRIADILMEIQNNMKMILERLKRVENSLQQNQNSWFLNNRPSKTMMFLILWPFVVNIIFKFLQRRYNGFTKR